MKNLKFKLIKIILLVVLLIGFGFNQVYASTAKPKVILLPAYISIVAQNQNTSSIENAFNEALSNIDKVNLASYNFVIERANEMKNTDKCKLESLCFNIALKEFNITQVIAMEIKEVDTENLTVFVALKKNDLTLLRTAEINILKNIDNDNLKSFMKELANSLYSDAKIDDNNNKTVLNEKNDYKNDNSYVYVNHYPVVYTHHHGHHNRHINHRKIIVKRYYNHNHPKTHHMPVGKKVVSKRGGYMKSSSASGSILKSASGNSGTSDYRWAIVGAIVASAIAIPASYFLDADLPKNEVETYLRPKFTGKFSAGTGVYGIDQGGMMNVEAGLSFGYVGFSGFGSNRAISADKLVKIGGFEFQLKPKPKKHTNITFGLSWAYLSVDDYYPASRIGVIKQAQMLKIRALGEWYFFNDFLSLYLEPSYGVTTDEIQNLAELEAGVSFQLYKRIRLNIAGVASSFDADDKGFLMMGLKLGR